jgi:hypothetical protein
MKYNTVVIDSAGELARLYFSKDLNKTADDTEKIRAVNNYPGATERLNMFIRRCKDLKKEGINVVFTAHEDIQRVYGRGTGIAPRGQQAPEPVAVKGQLDLPGNRTPDEFSRAADNIFHVRYVSGKPAWIARREAMTANDYWEVKDRFGGPLIQAGILPAHWGQLEALAKANPQCYWKPPYITVLYGPPGIGKTRSLLSFPTPLYLFDLDRGSVVIEREMQMTPDLYVVNDTINPEHGPDYEEFVSTFATFFNGRPR